MLAGGRSARFGSDKARFLLAGAPMALRVASAMRAAGAAPRLVVRDRSLEDLGLPLVLEDPTGPRHPLNGIVAALEIADGPALFAPCDLPWLPPEALVELAAGPPPRVAWDGAYTHPLVALYGPDDLPRARQILARQGAARALSDGAALVDVPGSWLRNVNRLSDL